MAPAVVAVVAQVVARVLADRLVAAVRPVPLPQQPEVGAVRLELLPQQPEVVAVALLLVQGLVASQSLGSR